jgi:hypothetical protein
VQSTVDESSSIACAKTIMLLSATPSDSQMDMDQGSQFEDISIVLGQIIEEDD